MSERRGSDERDERRVTEEQVYQEHMARVHVSAHWVYFVAVVLGGVALMLLFIAWLGG